MQAWLPALTAIIAALATLSGVYLSTSSSRRERALERAFVSQSQSNEFILRRGEELFIFIGNIDSYVACHVDLIEDFCHGHIDRERLYRERAILAQRREALEISRTQLLVHAFFESILPLYDEATDYLRHLGTLDDALGDAKDLSASTVYKISVDAVRLRKASKENGAAIRTALAKVVQNAFREQYRVNDIHR